MYAGKWLPKGQDPWSTMILRAEITVE
jgi:hypothetical protein